jgi:hypothetical protein
MQQENSRNGGGGANSNPGGISNKVDKRQSISIDKQYKPTALQKAEAGGGNLGMIDLGS